MKSKNKDTKMTEAVEIPQEPEEAASDNSAENLTAKNADYVHSVTKQLMLFGKTDEEVKTILADIVPQILEGQKSGTTARILLGTPTDFVSKYQPSPTSKSQKPKNTNPWLMTLDNFLLVFSLFTFASGAMLLFSKNAVSYGLTTLIIISLTAGFGMYALYHFYYSKMQAGERPKWNWKSLLAMLGIFVVWMLLISFSYLLPRVINPALSAPVMIVLAAAAFGLRFYLKRQFNIQPSLVSPNSAARPTSTNKK